MSAVFERITDGVALLALVSWIDPALYLALKDFSEIAALLTPPFALIWLMVQIWFRVSKGK